MEFFGRQKEKNENQFGKKFPRYRNIKLLWFAEENQHLGGKKCYTKERIPAIVIRSHCPQDQI